MSSRPPSGRSSPSHCLPTRRKSTRRTCRCTRNTVTAIGGRGRARITARIPVVFNLTTSGRELAPGHANAPNAARLLTFFAISDIHITDKESPAQPIYPGWSAQFGPSSRRLDAGSYSPIILSTTHVLDAAVQTINALHKKTPFDFGISLGDDCNNTQYNELRWFIDVLDGKVIIPSSGAHAGAETIDYQKPYKAAGLDKAIPWYQAIGNHDQYWSGIGYENAKLHQAHVGEHDPQHRPQFLHRSKLHQ